MIVQSIDTALASRYNIFMSFLINLIVGFVALIHLYFLTLEMFLWTTPFGLRVFGRSLEQAQASAALAANQGLYNGFLAAGLIWGMFHPIPEISAQIKIFFLACVVIAGFYGAYSVSIRILYIQALPATIALVLLLLKLGTLRL
jgi:putative membrane protein